ncbi:MAG: hypothetical protein WC241_03720 [Candidatus Paceibacterota bacterium]
MKKLFLILILAMNWLVSNGQTGPVFPYDNPSKQKLYNLATSDTPKGNAFIDYMVNVINIGLRDTTFRVSQFDVDDIFANLFLEEFYLNEGEYSNSGYNPSKEKMIPGVGHAWNGFGWVYRKGTFSLRLIKGDCANILRTRVLRKNVSPPNSSPPSQTPPLPFGPGLGTPTLPQATGQKVNQSVQELGNSSKTKEEKKERRVIKIRVGDVVITIAIVAIVVEAVRLLLHHHDSGEPGGAPPTPPVVPPVVPPIVPPVIPGGPGGAPTTP